MLAVALGRHIFLQDLLFFLHSLCLSAAQVTIMVATVGTTDSKSSMPYALLGFCLYFCSDCELCHFQKEFVDQVSSGRMSKVSVGSKRPSGLNLATGAFCFRRFKADTWNIVKHRRFATRVTPTNQIHPFKSTKGHINHIQPHRARGYIGPCCCASTFGACFNV